VVGYSRLAGADEERTLARLRALRSDLIDPTIALHHGRVVKRTGDGSIIEFRSVVDAVRCAIEVQRGMIERTAGLPPEKRIEFRVGIHLGDVVEESDGDLIGDGVNIAARLESIAEPGGICLSDDAFRQVRDRVKETFVDLGEKELTNIARAVRVYAIGGASSAAPDRSGFAGPAAPSRASIAVLPFVNMSGDPEQEYFADGISEDIITSLPKLPQLFVIARNTSFTFKGKNVHIGEVGKSLGVRYVVEGSVRKSGGRVRITAQLIDATTGGHAWAERFDRELTDIFAVQDDVAGKIVAALALNLSASDLQRIATPRTDNLEAYDCYLQARDLFWWGAKESNARPREMAERASQLDPNFAPAHVLLALIHNLDYLNEWSASPEHSRQRSRACAFLALSLDEADAYAH
jgi:adenylate cyclase